MGSEPLPADCPWGRWALAGVLNPAEDHALVTLLFFRPRIDTQKSILPATELDFLRLL